MGKLPKFYSDKLIVGFETSDDAAVYQLDDEKALIQTLDFFTPIVDDPYSFGRIAAANSLSDVYAMGGEPILALNIVGFPNCLNIEILGEILRGGAEKVKEAGALLVGGHTIEDDEPKYGLSVLGIVHPKKVLANSTAKPGDLLIITKPLGVGIINTAIKGGLASDDEIERAVFTMEYLNKDAADGMKKVEVNACTDITGFGLVGHLYEMANGSDVTIEIDSAKVPILEGAHSYAEMGLVPAGAYKNMHYVGENVKIEEGVSETLTDIFFDPQTSGGLLVSLSEEECSKLTDIYKDTLKTEFSVIGRVMPKDNEYIILK